MEDETVKYIDNMLNDIIKKKDSGDENYKIRFKKLFNELNYRLNLVKFTNSEFSDKMEEYIYNSVKLFDLELEDNESKYDLISWLKSLIYHLYQELREIELEKEFDIRRESIEKLNIEVGSPLYEKVQDLTNMSELIQYLNLKYLKIPDESTLYNLQLSRRNFEKEFQNLKNAIDILDGYNKRMEVVEKLDIDEATKGNLIILVDVIYNLELNYLEKQDEDILVSIGSTKTNFARSVLNAQKTGGSKSRKKRLKYSLRNKYKYRK